MTETAFIRNTLYWGDDFQNYLESRYIAVMGLGGVGGYALEAVARLGVSNLLIADFDTVSKTNINRQIIALNSTVGKKKTEVFENRLKDINPNINLKIYDGFLEEKVYCQIFEKKPDFIVDAIDTIKPKVELLKYAKENNIQIITSMGAGNRIDATKLYISDISEIQYKDNFTKNLLSKLKKYANIESGIYAVSSLEHAKNLKKVKNLEKIEKNDGEIIEFTKLTPASNSIVPAVSGLFIANKILEIIYKTYHSKIQA